MKLVNILLVTTPLVLANSYFAGKDTLALAEVEKIRANLLSNANWGLANTLDTWSEAEVKSWLTYHKLETQGNYEALLARAKANVDLLVADLEPYVDSAKETKDQLLAKGQEFYEQSADAVRAGFAEVSRQWSDLRLREFVEARGISVPADATHEKLLELADGAKSTAAKVQSNIAEPLRRYWFESWSRADLETALQSFGENVEGTRHELVDRITEAYNIAAVKFAEGEQVGAEAGQEAFKQAVKWKEAHFDTWTAEDVKEYLSSFGASVSDGAENFATKAEENYRYFIFGETKPKYVADRFGGHLAGVHSHLAHVLEWAQGVLGFGPKVDL